MRVVCAWCWTDMGEKPSLLQGTSHTICPVCKDKFFPEHKEVAHAQNTEGGGADPGAAQEQSPAAGGKE